MALRSDDDRVSMSPASFDADTRFAVVAIRLGAAMLLFSGCNASHPVARTTVDERYALSPGTRSLAYVLPHGRRTLELRTSCPRCTRTHLVVAFELEGAKRPPIALTLEADGKLVDANRDRERCAEHDVAKEAAPARCTVLVASGWDKLGVPEDERTFVLVVDNDGAARNATLTFDLRSVPRD